ncbi:MAG: sulfotransferase [Verrucomicrobiota bacterium]
MCKNYFGEKMVLAYASDGKNTRGLPQGNYLKDHDFGVAKGNPGIPFKKGPHYIVQYRHPLESIASLYEFRLFHGHDQDSREDWNHFLERNVAFWKRFIEKWCLRDLSHTGIQLLRIAYRDLCDDPLGTLSRVVEFAPLDGLPVDPARLQAAVEKSSGNFARYVQDQKEGIKTQTQRRQLRDFRYFSDRFPEIERELQSDYLGPLQIDSLFDPS